MKKLKTIILIALLTMLTNAQAILVSDPTSYSYYVEQLRSAKEQIDFVKNQLDEAKKLGNSFDFFTKELRENFDFAKGITGSLQEKLATFEKYRRALSSKDGASLDFARKFDPTNLRDVVDLNLDGIYIDPTDPSFDLDSIKSKRHHERQRLLKDGLIKTELELTQLEKTIKRVEKLSDKADNTTSLKESLDLNNTISLEILQGINTLIDVMSTLGQAEMAAKYVHHNQTRQVRQQMVDKAKYPKGYRSGGKVFKNSDEASEARFKCREYKALNGHNDVVIEGFKCPDRMQKEIDKVFWGK